MKWMMVVPAMLLPTPWASRPISLAYAVFHSEPLLPWSRGGSSRSCPVARSTAAPEKREASAGALMGGGGLLRCSFRNLTAYAYRFVVEGGVAPPNA